MAYIIRIPNLGMSMESGELLQWYVAEGDPVSEGDPIAEVESEKTIVDIDAREDGVLRKTVYEAGDSGPPGEPIGIVAEPDTDITDLLAEIDDGDDESTTEDTDTESRSVEPNESPSDAAGSIDINKPAQGPRETELDEDSTDDATDVKLSPKAKKVAAETGVDPGDVEGTGPGGAITGEDIERAAGDDQQAGILEERELSRIRRTIADRLSTSAREAVHVTEHRAIAIDNLISFQAELNESRNHDLTLNDLLLKVTAKALLENPEFNGTFSEGVHRMMKRCHISVAVDSEAGLLTPVIEDVAGRPIDAIHETRRDVVAQSLDGNPPPRDVAPTFTISNLGSLEIEYFTPVINPPQIAILGVGAIDERVTLTEDGAVDTTTVLPLSLSFDHRVVDGADAARFLESIAEYCAAPSDHRIHVATSRQR